MDYELMQLPYKYDALEPYISSETLQFHYDKHHAGYVAKLNELTKDSESASYSLVEHIQKSQGAIFNNAAQIFNHDFYWLSLTAKQTKPSETLQASIIEHFGSIQKFQEIFTQKAQGHFGSGWAWLCAHKDGTLSVQTSSNAKNPIEDSLVPLIVCDLWEHAYYIDYRNVRAKYLENYWQVLNWDFASFNYEHYPEFIEAMQGLKEFPSFKYQ